ncbi:SDR family NAD(P)-dependent oxidoreductase, partial [Actinomadura chokoriensis]
WGAVESGDAQALAVTLGLEGGDARSSLDTLLPVLSSWRKQRRDQTVVDGWRYRVTWKPLVGVADCELSGAWLVVLPAGWAGEGVAAASIHALTQRGARVVVVEVDIVDGDRDVLARQFRDLVGNEEPAGVLSLLALAGGRHRTHEVVPAGFAGALLLIQALGDADVRAPLWCVTQGAVSVAGSDGLERPVQALMWGLGRVAALEHPERWGGLIDLPEAPEERVFSRLCNVLAGHAGEDQVAIRAAGVFGRRLVRAPLGEAEPVREWKPQGTVLITGGTGALGAHVARWVAHNGAEHVVLTSRRGLNSPGAVELETELRELGVRVTVAACDVADRDALTHLIEAIPPEYPLTTIIHTAAALDDGAIDSLTVNQVDHVLRGKMIGALYLHELTEHLDLSAFIMFSSAAATAAASGQGNYAPANAFLDALAEHRRGRHLPATSLAWGAWDGEGMANLPSVGELLTRHGSRAMSPELAIAALQQALQHNETCLTVADIDWSRFFVAFTAMRPSPLLQEIPDVQQHLKKTDTEISPQSDPADRSLLRQRLAGLPEVEQDRVLLDLVRTHAAAVLGHGGPQAVEPTRAFKELGFDSVTAVELRNRLNSATGLHLPPTLIFDYPTATTLAHYLKTETIEDEMYSVTSAYAKLAQLEAILSSAPLGVDAKIEIDKRLRNIHLHWSLEGENPAENDKIDLRSASRDEVLKFIDKELGEL